MKLIVETTGPFQLMGSYMDGRDAVPHDRPAVVAATEYVQMRAAQGQLKVLKQDLSDGASDADFAKHWFECEGDLELAVESYVSTLTAAPVEEPKPKRGKTA